MSSDLVIRPARPDDAPRLHELHTASVRALCSGDDAADVIEGWLLSGRVFGKFGAPRSRGIMSTFP